MVALALCHSPFARARWLVLSPHADDETLGAGALIAEVAPEGRLAAIAYLTDGSGSHPHDDDASRRALIAIRRHEARRAIGRLAGRRAPPPVFLGWRDGTPFAETTPAFAATRDRIAALCRARRVDAIAVTAEGEAHCDHAAAFVLARAICGAARRPITLFEFTVWSDPPPGRTRTFHTRPMPMGLRRQALQAHRSQLTASFGQGFRLPADKVRMPARDRLYLRETPRAA
jgi:LmbE family N-acetylglucosaminyl deacetylase